MKHIAADLRPPLDLLLLALELRLLLLTFLQFQVIQTRFQDTEGVLPVVQLRTRLGILHHYPGRDMLHPHSGLDLVHVLSACAAGPVCVPLQIGRIDLYLDRVIDKRVHEHRRECSLSLALGIERRDTHQTVHPALGLQITEGIVPFELHCDRLDPGILPFEFIGDCHLVAVTLPPAHIHTHQHRGPVVGLRPSCT